MKTMLLKITMTLMILMTSFFASARQTSSDYMACSIVNNENYVGISAIPQAFVPSKGREESIARRSCDTHLVKMEFGWATQFDCTQALRVMTGMMRQLVQSGVCPAGSEDLVY